MKFLSAMLVTRDMAAARKFYEEILLQQVEMDLGANLTFKSGFALQTLDSWAQFIGKDAAGIAVGGDDVELYFEEEDFESFAGRLQSLEVRMVQPIGEQPWGQRVARFYDPDGHMVEVGESMPVLVRRLAAGGMTAEEITRKTMLPPAFVQGSLAGAL